MKKNLKWSILCGLVSALCLLAAACEKKDKDDEMAEQGYVVAVTYDAGSGRFFSRDGVTIKDYVNPASFDDDGDGVAEIKLMDPEDPLRKSSVGKTGHFLAGWYQKRELVKTDGKILDESGRELEELDGGIWIVKGTKDTPSYPVYRYSDPWDFSTDLLTYDPSRLQDTDGRLTMTLYAGWLPYYEFHYYYQENGSWVQKEKTTFDYGANLKKGGDYDTIWMPDWKDCAMNYKYTYGDGKSNYAFPKLAGTTFLKAYTDSEMQNEITGSLVHPGTLDRENCTAVNAVQNVYVTVEEGERYKISTAKQLSDNYNANGYYEIYSSELDFTDIAWDKNFSLYEFNGKFYPADGVSSVTVSNVSVSVVSSSATYAGLFGRLGKKAVLQNVSFENVTVDFSSIRGTGGKYGLLAGEIDDDATVSGVTVGGTLKVGDFSDYAFTMNAVANGNVAGVAHTPITLIFYGQDFGYSRYPYDPRTADVDEETGAVTFTVVLTMVPNLALEFQKTYN